MASAAAAGAPAHQLPEPAGEQEHDHAIEREQCQRGQQNWPAQVLAVRSFGRPPVVH